MRNLLLASFLCFTVHASSQLTIYGGNAQTGISASCVIDSIYIGGAIPESLNNDISSIQLQQGFMATLAENENGTGEAYTFIAAVSNITVDLNPLLNNRVSFIRVLPFRNTLKKGAGLGSSSNKPIGPLDVSWFYNWGFNDVSVDNREYVAMSWGRSGVTNATNLQALTTKKGVSHLLSFNEPDNAGQANIPATEADLLHQRLAQTGLRLGSPAPTESQAFVWLPNFMGRARPAGIKVDFMAVHWYDWGSYLQTLNKEPNVTNMFTRFKNYINYVYAMYGKPIWITEFNANPNTSSATHEAFIALALPWLEAQPFVERYAYFFPSALQAIDPLGYITPIGQAYKNFAASTPAIAKNYDNSELLTNDLDKVLEAEQAAIYNTGTAIQDCAAASGGKMANTVTGNLRIGFHEIHVPISGTYKIDVSYLTTGASALTIRTNHGAPQTFSLPASGSLFCFQGGKPSSFEIEANLLAGNNSIEFTASPTLDFIRVKTNSALPVKLTDFSGTAQAKTIDLVWRTAQEQNSHYFEVLKLNSTNQFVAIEKLYSIGNSNSPTSYGFKDVKPHQGLNYYKLKMVDKDGTFTHSNTIAVQFDAKSTGLALISATSSRILVSAYSPIPQKASFNLFSINGSLILTQPVTLNRGINYLEIPAHLSSNNIMILSLYTSKNVESIKIIRQ
ncbi:MAG: hypothetical protein EAY75_09310 [Bacteroidetes bacterium]|nr:MAG: hypothetical protein EAY75_09310 [Bacteroidota bacterium]